MHASGTLLWPCSDFARTLWDRWQGSSERGSYVETSYWPWRAREAWLPVGLFKMWHWSVSFSSWTPFVSALVRVIFSKLQMGSNVLFGEQWLATLAILPCTPLFFSVLLMMDSWTWTLATVRAACRPLSSLSELQSSHLRTWGGCYLFNPLPITPQLHTHLGYLTLDI